VRLDVLSQCLGCASTPTPFAGATVQVASPPLGARRTPFSFSVAGGSRVTLTAAATASTGGRGLRFAYWLSVTDNRILTGAATLSGSADKTEVLAAVYSPVTGSLLTLNLVSLCDAGGGQATVCFGPRLSFTRPALGTRATPVVVTLAARAALAVTAPASFSVGGRTLAFVHWLSVTDNRVLTTSPTLSGTADRHETLAPVYRASPLVPSGPRGRGSDVTDGDPAPP
jgi:hypothetical protein